MSWVFKRDSPLRSSLRKYSFSLSPKLEEGTCLEVFQTHWQQAYGIIKKNGMQGRPTSDDVTGVINNLDQMVTLLLQEAQLVGSGHGPLLDYLLVEGCLDKLLGWALRAGEFVDVVRVEQLKFYEILISNCHQDLLFHKPIVRPLLRLLASCSDCVHSEVEKRLILLLNTLCVCLKQFPDLLQVFFGASSEHGPTRSDKRDMFLIFSLLIPYVHREGSIGQQARDALLLCMALSRKNENIGVYIAEHSNFCPVLATGLSGLYSLLPRKIQVVSDDWHRFTPEDILEMPELAMFLNSLEFCNAVIQVAHPLVQEQLMEYLYQGFLVPVLGPALHQNTIEEIVATTAYLELFVRTITEPILLQMFLKFILTSSYDGHRILHSLVDRLGAQTRLCIVTMALFQSLLDLNSEDVLFELVFRYLIPCTHIMVSQRSRVRDADLYNQAAEKFLALVPLTSYVSSTAVHAADSLPPRLNRGGSLRLKNHNRSPSTASFAFGEIERVLPKLSTEWYVVPHPKQSSYMDYLCNAHKVVSSCTLACKTWSTDYDGRNPAPNAEIKSPCKEMPTLIQSRYQNGIDCANNDIVNNIEKDPKTDSEIEHGSGGDQQSISLLLRKQNQDSNELMELSTKNVGLLQNSFQKKIDCLSQKQSYVITKLNQHNEFLSVDMISRLVETEDEKLFWSLVCSIETDPSSTSQSSPANPSIERYFDDLDATDILRTFADSKDETSNADSGVFESRDSEKDSFSANNNSQTKDSLFINIPQKSDSKQRSSSSVSETSTKSNSPASTAMWETFSTPNIGPFLGILLTRLEMMMQNDVYTNLHLTGLISRLACYPQPLLRSFLLNPSLVFQPTVRSLFQVLGSLKHKVDSYSHSVKNYEELVGESRQFLNERLLHTVPSIATTRSYSTLSHPRSTTVSDFRRGDSRRRSLTNFLKNSFLRTRDHNFSKEPVLESISDGQGYKYVNKPSYCLENDETEMETLKTRNAVLCAVILEEFLKELASISQEHSIVQLNPDFWDNKDAPWL